MKKIKGTSRYQNIEMGFWSIIAQDGTEYRPVNMPEQLKMEGAKIECYVTPFEEFASMIMWGQAVKIVSFETLTP